jgi:ABC-type uncharacterized transport system fused permease/ATPase subunit
MFEPDFVVRYLILFSGCVALLRLVYFRISPKREATFSFFLFGNGVFLVTYLIHGIELSMGFAFGLFAVFAMLRYRTEPISIRDMTYLFIVIGIALVCAIAELGYLQLFLVVAFICALSAYGETRWLAPKISEYVIRYDNIANIQPDKRGALIADLSQRTGLKIENVDIGNIDFLTDSAFITLYTKEGTN